MHPLRQEENSIDALFILNHAPTRQYKRVLEFITFISPVLALSIQNYQLYLQLKHKNEELDSWIAHVESRIEEGTKKLLEREYQYHALFEATNDGIIVHDRDGRLVEANTAVCRLLDYEKKELVALNWNQLTINDLIEQQKALFEKVLSKKKSIRLRPH